MPAYMQPENITVNTYLHMAKSTVYIKNSPICLFL